MTVVVVWPMGATFNTIYDDCCGDVTDGCHIQYNIQHSLIVSA